MPNTQIINDQPCARLLSQACKKFSLGSYFFNWAFPGLFLDFLFIFFLGSLFILQLTNFGNGNRSMHCSITQSFWKSPAPRENWFAAILNQEKPSPSRDLNPACSDRMPLLYCLRHHRSLNPSLLVQCQCTCKSDSSNIVCSLKLEHAYFVTVQTFKVLMALYSQPFK